MSKFNALSKLVSFDAACYLTDDEAVAEYVAAVLDTDDPDLLLLALGDIARARTDRQPHGQREPQVYKASP